MINAYEELLSMLRSAAKYANYYILRSNLTPYTYGVIKDSDNMDEPTILFVGNYKETKAFITGLLKAEGK